jgi:hypothetical protein
VGVLDVDGGDLPGPGGTYAEPLAGARDDAVPGDLAPDSDRARRRAGSCVPAILAPRGIVRSSAGTGRWQGLGEDPSAVTWRRCPSSRSVTLPRASSGPILSRWTRGRMLSTPAGEITVSNSTLPPAGDSKGRGSGPAAAAGPACYRGAVAAGSLEQGVKRVVSPYTTRFWPHVRFPPWIEGRELPQTLRNWRRNPSPWLCGRRLRASNEPAR